MLVQFLAHTLVARIAQVTVFLRRVHVTTASNNCLPYMFCCCSFTCKQPATFEAETPIHSKWFHVSGTSQIPSYICTILFIQKLGEKKTHWMPLGPVAARMSEPTVWGGENTPIPVLLLIVNQGDEGVICSISHTACGPDREQTEPLEQCVKWN